ncbi:putative B3 domain-containing protein At5g66980 isoform X2 [Telopea speciosissima]|uniref:putative B3 domain-containing protein At5g66980 isoform X2 n=1 Tax=Telopea speciosissima TaxID=54955 RepID=UPI001CC3FF18|nr:putative B3 domain-containing protein At5g66980 isoform X2 [Telopea speciosissima]
MGRKPSFFKVLLRDFSKRLLIPPEFIKHFNRNLPGIFILRNPNGKLWPVRVKKLKDNWFFRRGWRQFVRYHRLKPGEFLIFRYNGDSKFRVTIFAKNACEKEFPSSAKRRKNSDHENGNNHLHTKKEEPISFSDDEDEPISESKKKILISEIVKEKPSSHILKEVLGKKKSLKSSKKGVAYGKMTSESSVSKKTTKSRIPANKIERNGNLEAVRLFKTEHPHFTQIMRTNSRYQITVPRAIAVKNGFIDKEIAEIQDPQGRLWTLKIAHMRDGRTFLRTGLLEFWNGNKLVEGDACVFELIEVGETKNAMRVHIFRVVETH